MIHTKALEKKAEELTREGIGFTLATVVRCKSPTSAKPGAKALVTEHGDIHGWIGGGCAQPAVIKTVRHCLADGKPQLIRVTPTKAPAIEDGLIEFNMACHSGGTLDIFIEPVSVKPTILIIGGSPVAQALSRIASATGFSVYVTADNADEELFPDADGLETDVKLTDFNLNRQPFVVVASQGKRDEIALKSAVRIGSPYTALVASEKKAGKLKASVAEKTGQAEFVESIRSPAGIEISANSPEEIAVALLAEIIAVKNSAELDMSQPVEMQAEESTTEAEATSCCASKETENKEEPTAEQVITEKTSGCCGSDN